MKHTDSSVFPALETPLTGKPLLCCSFPASCLQHRWGPRFFSCFKSFRHQFRKTCSSYSQILNLRSMYQHFNTKRSDKTALWVPLLKRLLIPSPHTPILAWWQKNLTLAGCFHFTSAKYSLMGCGEEEYGHTNPIEAFKKNYTWCATKWSGTICIFFTTQWIIKSRPHWIQSEWRV